MVTILRNWIIAGILLSLSACASIVSKSSWPVTINTYPSGANVEITDLKGKVVYNGHSPACMNLSSSAGYFEKQSYRIKISMDGYSEKIIPLECKLNAWYIGNVFLGGFGAFVGCLIVDPVTGAMFKLDKEYICETLVKNPNENTGLKVVALQDIPDNWKEHLVSLY